MAWGDPGGPGSGDMGGGNFGGMDGHGGFADSVASEGPGEGYGGGHSNASSGDTNQGLGTDSGVSQAAIDAANKVAGFDAAASAAEAAFGGWQSQVDTQMSPQNVGYQDSSPSAMAIATRPQISRQARTSALEVGGLTDLNNQAARPGALANIGTGLLTAANPVLGLAARGYQAHSAAKDAQARTAATNAAFGTNVDHSYGNALGAQARGQAAGAAFGRLGGEVGANLGAGITGSVEGAMAGGITGSAALGGFASHTAKGSMRGGNVSDGNRANSDGARFSGNTRDNADLTNPQDIARAREDSERNQSHPIASVNNSQMYGYKPASYQFDSLADATSRIFA